MRTVRRLAAGAAIALASFLLWMGFVWPPPSWWRTHWPAHTAFMTMRAAQFRAGRNPAPFRYDPVPFDSMSLWLPKAATAGEDEAFYQHHGIDYRALREAIGYRRVSFTWSSRKDRTELWRALGQAWGRREKLRGASTITQQLAKNLYLSPSRNPLRKVKEAAIAYRLEWALDKERILALYLNVAELGPNVWGVAAASQRYFGTTARRVSMSQAALLVATLPHPLTSNPSYRPGRTRWRQQLILLKLGGAPVVIPAEAPEDTLPALPVPPVDSGPGLDTARAAPSHADTTGPGRDTAAVPARKPDTAAAPPRLPAPPGARERR